MKSVNELLDDLAETLQEINKLPLSDWIDFHVPGKMNKAQQLVGQIRWLLKKEKKPYQSQPDLRGWPRYTK